MGASLWPNSQDSQMPNKMDPFSSLPAEIRIQILTQLQPNSLHRMVKASPAMLHQYTHSRGYIAGVFIAQDFDDELIQDAMAVLTFPDLDTTKIGDKAVDRHLALWASKQFSNPLETHDQEAIEDLDRLRIRLRVFMGDYVAKATTRRALFRQYRHLPGSSPTQTGIFDVDRLSGSERKRFFQAFLRHEILCKIYHPKEMVEPLLPWNWKKLWEVRGIHDVSSWEMETMLCVQSYIESLYGAMIIRCNDAKAREEPPIFPRQRDRYYDISWDPYYSVCLSTRETSAANTLAHYGLDLVVGILKVANTGINGCRRLGSWFKAFTVEVRTSFDGVPPNIDLGIPDRDGPGFYHKLVRSSFLDCFMDAEVYRQRAWAFFDDDRFMPKLATSELFSGEAWQKDIRNDELHDHFKGQVETLDDYDDPPVRTKGHGKKTDRVQQRFFARRVVAVHTYAEPDLGVYRGFW
ncbi:hypothetical protein N0V84_002612 [Fusarium piperis]|uniref:F-box domain-containing protein n=1 Tax=Fusarium piperis TaxID=1435070 RepID=A0A9W8WIZ4_9HYPO|nr:hypothetical protein N0V84_002612 [Fusarium piperis]